MARVSGGAQDAGDYRGETPPPDECPAWKRRIFIDRASDLLHLAQEMLEARVIAIDAEFTQVRRREPDDPPHRLALLQLALDNNYRVSYVVDTLRMADVSALQAPLASPTSLKLFHGISTDARVLATRGLVARHTLDLEAVSRSLFGQRESSLQHMLQRACGIRLDKSLQRADWARRPLTPAMVAYAARDAEMTYALYRWLETHYEWATTLYETPADAPTPDVAGWIAPYLEGRANRPVDQAVAEAGLAWNRDAQTRDLGAALDAVKFPAHRSRIMRMIADLGLTSLAPRLRESLDAWPSEERAGAARALGRLRDHEALPALRALQDDPVSDVRVAAALAADFSRPTPSPTPHEENSDGVRSWVVNGESTASAAPDDDWRAALRERFSATSPSQTETASDTERADDDDDARTRH